MEQRNTAAVLFAAAAASTAALTYGLRRAGRREPRMQTLTIAAPRERVEGFVTDRGSMLRALESDRDFDRIENMELRDAPDARGTEIRLTMYARDKYAVKEVLRRTKSLVETGEIPTARYFV